MNEFTLTADPADTPTPMRIRAAMAETADPQSLRVWDAFLDRVYAKALETGDITPLRRFLAGTQASIATYRNIQENGLPPREQRVSSTEFLTSWHAAHPGHDLTAWGGQAS